MTLTTAKKKTIRRRLHAKCKRCRWCGKELALSNATIEHVKPKRLGGSDRFENLALACKPCNESRGSDPKQIEKYQAMRRSRKLALQRRRPSLLNHEVK